MDNLIFVSCQPHNIYFQWQVEVQITNFRKHKISDKMHILVWHPKGSIELSAWHRIQDKYPEVHIHFYKDEGVNIALYVSQLRPHTLKKFFSEHTEMLKDKTIFYHDSDIIFNYLPDFKSLIEGPICWQSDCSGYLDYRYLRSIEKKGNIPEDEAVSILANIGGITIDVIKSYTEKTGGAQVILKNIDAAFWQDVENQVVDIRKAFFWGWDDRPNIGSVNHKYFTTPGNTAKENEDAGFQSWCADMWALNFALWKRGIPTDITKELDFSWATNDAQTYKEKPIMHNAGALPDMKGVFYKGNWQTKSPIGFAHKVKKNSASFYYVRAIADTLL